MLTLHHELFFMAVARRGIEQTSGDYPLPAKIHPSLFNVIVNVCNFDLFGLEVVGIVNYKTILNGEEYDAAVEMHFLHRDRGRGCVVGGVGGVGCVAHTRTLE
jgi:hypothetical protein